MGSNSPKRYRISVPLDDMSVIEWMSCQHSPSLSIRQLVKAAIEVNGMRDYFASDSGEVVQKPRRGRPPKALSEAYDEEEPFTIEKPEASATAPKATKKNSDVSDRIRQMQGLLNK